LAAAGVAARACSDTRDAALSRGMCRARSSTTRSCSLCSDIALCGAEKREKEQENQHCAHRRKRAADQRQALEHDTPVSTPRIRRAPRRRPRTRAFQESLRWGRAGPFDAYRGRCDGAAGALRRRRGARVERQRALAPAHYCHGEHAAWERSNDGLDGARRGPTVHVPPHRWQPLVHCCGAVLRPALLASLRCTSGYRASSARRHRVALSTRPKWSWSNFDLHYLPAAPGRTQVFLCEVCLLNAQKCFFAWNYNFSHEERIRGKFASS
jgi:hypothetical protein